MDFLGRNFQHAYIPSLTPVQRKKSLEDIELNLIKQRSSSDYKIAFIGIYGGPSCGKSKIAEYFKKKVKGLKVIEEKDFYIKDVKEGNSSLVDETILNKKDDYPMERKIELISMSDPNAYDYDKIYNTLNDLKHGKKVTICKYDEKMGKFKEKQQVIDPKDTEYLMISGCFILGDQRIRELLSMKIYVEIDDDVRIGRMMIKENDFLQNNPEAFDTFHYIYVSKISPSFKVNILPTKKYANIILPNYSINNDNEIEGAENLNVLIDLLNSTYEDIKIKA